MSAKNVSVRDKAATFNAGIGMNCFNNLEPNPIEGSLMNVTQKTIQFQSKYIYKSTFDIINSLKSCNFPSKAIFTFHPQRWTNEVSPWTREFLLQNLKNSIKYFISRFK